MAPYHLGNVGHSLDPIDVWVCVKEDPKFLSFRGDEKDAPSTGGLLMSIKI